MEDCVVTRRWWCACVFVIICVCVRACSCAHFDCMDYACGVSTVMSMFHGARSQACDRACSMERGNMEYVET